jgi:hypothetical protein
MLSFRIHGDNIVECERTLDLVARALGIPPSQPLVPSGSPLAPTYTLTPPDSAESMQFTFFPGYGRWDTNILEIIHQRGGVLREAADAIISRVQGRHEDILISMEYCGALPAGNQAWQRNGRAFSFAHAKLPYIYIAELSGYELNAKRERKAARLPNPAVPFSYLLLTKLTKSPAVPVFVRSPGASDEAVKSHSPFFGEEELLDFLRKTLLGESTDGPQKALEAKVLELVKFLADSRRQNDTLLPDQWAAALATVSKGGSLTHYLTATPRLKWSKTAYITGLTASARKFMAITATFALGLTSTSLPMCIVPEDSRASYAKEIHELYPETPKHFLEWCSRGGHLAVCWVMGFKPKGDDARPDRGLPPLCRMLVGDKTDMLTIVYGPAPKSTWPLLESSPSELMKQNGLWEAVLVSSDAVFVDSSSIPKTPPLAYLKAHWASTASPPPVGPFSVTPAPIHVGENDVDTVLHLLFARLGYPHVFEGMCNPPGGDWSGLSMLTEDKKQELRWLGLPRVTAHGAKRPDHVFQVFDYFKPFLVVAIESKERSRSVEDGIGPRLRKYVGALVEVMPSVQRAPASAWCHYSHTVDRPPPKIASAAAFVATSKSELTAVATRAEVDVVFGFVFPPSRDSCTIWAQCCTSDGKAVCDFLSTLSLTSLRLRMEIQS